jgi:hypothetical protein
MTFFLLTELRERRAHEAPAALDPMNCSTREFSVAEARQMVRKGEIMDMKNRARIDAHLMSLGFARIGCGRSSATSRSPI